MIGQRIRELRTQHGLTQRELADFLGLTHKMISFYEHEQRTPPADILKKLAKRFNVSVDYLLGNDHTLTNELQQVIFAASKAAMQQMQPSYYIDNETAQLADDIKDNPDLRILLDASRDLKPETLKELDDKLN